MTPPEHASEDNSFARDVGTQTGKAIGLIVVAVIIAVLLLRHVNSPPKVSVSSSKTTATTAPPPPPTPTTVALLPPNSVKLLVLNGTLKGTLASEFTAKLRKDPGYDTLSPDNTTKAVTASMVYAASPQYAANAQALAQSLGLSTGVVGTSVPSDAPISASEKANAQIILIIGSDLAAKGVGSTSSSSSSTSSGSSSTSSTSASSGSSTGT